MLRIFSVFVLTAAVLTIVYIAAAGNRKMREHIAIANKATLTVINNEIDKTLNGVDDQFFLLPYDLFSLSQDAFETKLYMSSYLRNIVSAHPLVNGLWLYLPGSDEFVVSTAGVSNIDESDAIVNELAPRILAHRMGRPMESSKWRIEKLNGAFYLTRLLEINGNYCGAWIHIDTLTRTFRLREGTFLVFKAVKSDVFSGEDIFSQFVLDDKQFVTANGLDDMRYIAVSAKTQAGDYFVSYVAKENLTLFDRDVDIFLMASVAAAAIILFFVSATVLQRLIYRPLITLHRTMNEVGKGDMSPAIDTSRLLEFQEINQTFIYMLEEIKTLKIDVYEQRLDRQQIKQRFLQIQLKSHFYLNCLNIIHALAQVKNFLLIQDLTRSLGAYFRYMTDDFSKLNALGEELEHLQNYMHVQEIRFPNCLTYRVNVSPELLSVGIPPLILQTFIENAVEHAIDLDKNNHITLTITQNEIDDTRGIEICVQDNGKGFSTEQLRKFNSCEEETFDQRDEIGIKNVINRLRLIYEGKVVVQFSNATKGGAVVRIWIPMLTEVAGGNV
jgi:two-component system sensor histidine kinase YesM